MMNRDPMSVGLRFVRWAGPMVVFSFISVFSSKPHWLLRGFHQLVTNQLGRCLVVSKLGKFLCFIAGDW